MKVSIEQWHRVISCFLRKTSVEISTQMATCSLSLRLCLLFVSLLLTVSVEPNPGPTRNDDIIVKLNQLSNDVKDVCE